MSTIRRERLEEQLVRELTDIFRNRLKDPRRDGVSVIRVDLTQDLRFARVHISVFGDAGAKKEAMKMLDKAAPFIRGELGRRLHIRYVPEIRFQPDESLEASQRVMKILDELEIPEEKTPEEDLGDQGDGS